MNSFKASFFPKVESFINPKKYLPQNLLSKVSNYITAVATHVREKICSVMFNPIILVSIPPLIHYFVGTKARVDLSCTG